MDPRQPGNTSNKRGFFNQEPHTMVKKSRQNNAPLPSPSLSSDIGSQINSIQTPSNSKKLEERTVEEIFVAIFNTRTPTAAAHALGIKNPRILESFLGQANLKYKDLKQLDSLKKGEDFFKDGYRKPLTITKRTLEEMTIKEILADIIRAKETSTTRTDAKKGERYLSKAASFLGVRDQTLRMHLAKFWYEEEDGSTHPLSMDVMTSKWQTLAQAEAYFGDAFHQPMKASSKVPIEYYSLAEIHQVILYPDISLYKAAGYFAVTPYKLNARLGQFYYIENNVQFDLTYDVFKAWDVETATQKLGAFYNQRDPNIKCEGIIYRNQNKDVEDAANTIDPGQDDELNSNHNNNNNNNNNADKEIISFSPTLVNQLSEPIQTPTNETTGFTHLANFGNEIIGNFNTNDVFANLGILGNSTQNWISNESEFQGNQDPNTSVTETFIPGECLHLSRVDTINSNHNNNNNNNNNNEIVSISPTLVNQLREAIQTPSDETGFTHLADFENEIIGNFNTSDIFTNLGILGNSTQNWISSESEFQGNQDLSPSANETFNPGEGLEDLFPFDLNSNNPNPRSPGFNS